MINLSSMRSRNQHARPVSIPILERLTSQNLHFIAVISVFLAAIFIASCGDEGDITEDTTGMTDVLQPTTTPETQPSAEDPVVIGEPVVVEEPKASFKADIQPILAERCATPGCHVAGHFTGLDLSKYDTFKNFEKAGNARPAFVAGDGEGSLVVERIDGGGMPPGGPPLDGDQIQLFIDWIDEGAENN